MFFIDASIAKKDQSAAIFHSFKRPNSRRHTMKAYLENLPTKAWFLLVVPAMVLAYPGLDRGSRCDRRSRAGGPRSVLSVL
jgi:hypothetical protein